MGMSWLTHTAPAVKVPGLVFCAGQTATGEIKQATVSQSQALQHKLVWEAHSTIADTLDTRPE